MTARKAGSLISRAWKWWAEPSSQRRLVAWLVVCAVVAWGFVSLQSTDATTRSIVKQQETDRLARRIENASDKFGLCQGNNAAIGVLDQVLTIAGSLGADQRSPEQQQRTESFFAALRGPLALRDCSVYLRDLTPAQRDEVRSTTIPPTIPRSATTIHQ